MTRASYEEKIHFTQWIQREVDAAREADDPTIPDFSRWATGGPEYVECLEMALEYILRKPLPPAETKLDEAEARVQAAAKAGQVLLSPVGAQFLREALKADDGDDVDGELHDTVKTLLEEHDRMVKALSDKVTL